MSCSTAEVSVYMPAITVNIYKGSRSDERISFFTKEQQECNALLPHISQSQSLNSLEMTTLKIMIVKGCQVTAVIPFAHAWLED